MQSVRAAWRGAIATLGMLLSWQALGQTDSLGDAGYRSLVEKSQGRLSTDTDLFGESWDPDTGMLQFRQQDLSLAGVGPTITLARAYANGFFRDVLLSPWTVGDWALSIPRIETTATQPVSGTSTPGEFWVVEQAGNEKYKRCSKFGAPVRVFDMDTWWFGGFTLVDEKGVRQSVLKRDVTNTAAPISPPISGGLAIYPAVTRKGWQIGCLPSTTNGQSGEGFVAVSPSGDKYFFTHLVHKALLTLKEMDFGSGTMVRQGRMLATMYVSKVEDRFGNAVNYIYSGSKLTSIEAADGRKVTLTWRADASVISSISTIDTSTGVPTRTWLYNYDISNVQFPRLNSVTNPDGSQWTFHGMSAFDLPSGMQFPTPCGMRVQNSGTSPLATATVSAPSGGTAAFGAAVVVRAYSKVGGACYPQYGTTGNLYESAQLFRGGRGLVSKTISGPGITTATWLYRYSTATASKLTDPCAAAGTCEEMHWAKVIAPDGSFIQTYFSNVQLDKREGLPLAQEAYSAEGARLRRIDYAYAPYDQGPWPRRVGGVPEIDFNTPGGNDSPESYILPISSVTTSQQGRVFRQTVNTFDSFGRPTILTKESFPAP